MWSAKGPRPLPCHLALHLFQLLNHLLLAFPLVLDPNFLLLLFLCPTLLVLNTRSALLLLPLSVLWFQTSCTAFILKTSLLLLDRNPSPLCLVVPLSQTPAILPLLLLLILLSAYDSEDSFNVKRLWLHLSSATTWFNMAQAAHCNKQLLWASQAHVYEDEIANICTEVACLYARVTRGGNIGKGSAENWMAWNDFVDNCSEVMYFVLFFFVFVFWLYRWKNLVK